MPRQICENKEDNEKKCPCDEKRCVRHGICCECILYHRTHKEDGLPACMC